MTGHTIAGEEALVFSYNLATPFRHGMFLLEFCLDKFSLFAIRCLLRHASDNLKGSVLVADVDFVKQDSYLLVGLHNKFKFK